LDRPKVRFIQEDWCQMKMLARLRYLLEEDFNISALSGYDDDSGEGNAQLMFVEMRADGSTHLRSEIFDVGADEMEQVSTLFLAHLAEGRKE
jgi:hypothetical protein